jgi:hypothetical protein
MEETMTMELEREWDNQEPHEEDIVRNTEPTEDVTCENEPSPLDSQKSTKNHGLEHENTSEGRHP